MRSSFITTAFAALAAAVPVEKRQAAAGGPSDGVILNYALTLENLENAFYMLGLSMFSEEDFEKAGLPKEFYGNLKEISSDEKTHVAFLSGALSGSSKLKTASVVVVN